jgi:hypothetical protein
VSLATTYTATKINELLTNLQTAIESTYLKKNVAPGVPANYVPTAAGDDTWAWGALPIAWKKIVDPATDTRPTAAHVIWVGGSTAPTNMTAEDAFIPSP